MFYNIGYTNTEVIYWHSTVIAKVMLLYNTERQYDHGMTVNYHGKEFYNIGSWCQFHQYFRAAFSYESFLRGFYVLTIWVCNFLAKEFWHKSCS